MIRVDGDKDGFAGGEDVTAGVGDFRFALMAAAMCLDVARGERERLAERNRAKVVDLHVAGHGHDTAGAVSLAHGFVKKGRDDAAVRVAGRPGKAAGQTQAADDVALFIDKEFETQAGGVFEAAAEAVIEGAVGEGREGISVGRRFAGGHDLSSIYRISESKGGLLRSPQVRVGLSSAPVDRLLCPVQSRTNVAIEAARSADRKRWSLLYIILVLVAWSLFLNTSQAQICTDIRRFDMRNATIHMSAQDDGGKLAPPVFHLHDGVDRIFEFGSLEWQVELDSDRTVHPDAATWLRVVMLEDVHMGGSGTLNFVLAFDCEKGRLVRLFQYGSEGIRLKHLDDRTLALDQAVPGPDDSDASPSEYCEVIYQWVARDHRYHHTGKDRCGDVPTATNRR